MRGHDNRIKNAPRVRCSGFVAGTAAYDRAMDLMVIPTSREGFSCVVREAATPGIPVITALSTGSRDSLVPEVTGILIPPCNAAAISEAILKLLRDPKQRRRMGNAARAWVTDHYANTRVLGLIAEYYKTLLSPSSNERQSGVATDLAVVPR